MTPEVKKILSEVWEVRTSGPGDWYVSSKEDTRIVCQKGDREVCRQIELGHEALQAIAAAAEAKGFAEEKAAQKKLDAIASKVAMMLAEVEDLS